MSIVAYLPRLGLFDRTVRRARHPQHRAVDEVERQKILRVGADFLIKGLQLQLEEQAAEHHKVIARIDARHAEVVEGLEAQIAELERRISIGVLAESVVTETQELSVEEIHRHCVKPLYEAPFATVNPGRVTPSWARTDTAPATP
ncbi:hypothetical protein AB0N99_30485 [Streptomyces sp. NPDC093272]|uniref:hypothetical protein n=1 Tax=Streptomyces sp. NPDC093272 TaxID=3154981 RepID=UPI00344AD917